MLLPKFSAISLGGPRTQLGSVVGPSRKLACIHHLKFNSLSHGLGLPTIVGATVVGATRVCSECVADSSYMTLLAQWAS